MSLFSNLVTVFAPQVLAPVLTGIWAKYYGFELPLLAAVVLVISAGVYVLLLPESLPPLAASRYTLLHLDPLQTFRNLRFLFRYKAVKGRSPLPWVGFAFFLFFMASLGGQAVNVVYTKHRFHWDSDLIGIFDGCNGLLFTISMIATPRLFTAMTGVHLKVITWIQIGYIFR